MGLLDGIVKSVFDRNLDRAKLEIGTDVKRGVQGALGGLTNGILGDRNAGQQTVNGRGAAPRPEAGPAGATPGINAPTQGFLERFGFGGGKQGNPGIADTVAGIPGRLAGAILPSTATVNRLTAGAAAVGAAVTGGVAGVAVATQRPAPVEEKSTYASVAPATPATQQAAPPVAESKPVVSAPPAPAAVAAPPSTVPDTTPIVTSVAPTTEFASVAPGAPAKPVQAPTPAPTSATPGLDAAQEGGGRFGADVYERARQQIAKIPEPGPGMG